MKIRSYKQHTAKILPQRLWLIMLLFIGISFSGCEEKEEVDPGQCGLGNMNCGTYVTVKSAMCGTGLWGNLWLQLDNGQWLQPWDIKMGSLPEITVGQRLKIGYTVIPRDNKYMNVITCMAVPPAAEAIRITCLEPVAATTCDTYATVVMDSCFPAYWGDVSLQLDNGDWLRPWEGLAPSQPLQNGQRIKISYEVSQLENKYVAVCQTFAAIPPFTPIKVTCFSVPQPTTNCSVFATAENVVCGGGVWANSWLRLDDSTFLQPWESLVPNFQLQAGMRYKIGYETMPRDNRYNSTIICAAMPPAADAVRITCIEPVAPTAR